MSDRLYQIKYLNAVAIDWIDGKPKGRKYHAIKNNATYQAAFIKMIMEKFPACTHVNFYNKETGKFAERIYTT